MRVSIVVIGPREFSRYSMPLHLTLRRISRYNFNFSTFYYISEMICVSTIYPARDIVIVILAKYIHVHIF